MQLGFRRLIFAGLALSTLTNIISGGLSASSYAYTPYVQPKSDLLAENKNQVIFRVSDSLVNGQKYLAAGQAAKAVQIFQDYTCAHSDDGEGYFWLGTALNEVGDAKGSLAAFSKAVSLNSLVGADSAQLRVNFGNSFLALERTDEALFQYHKATSLDPAEPRAYYNLARAQIKKESPITAEAALGNLEKAKALGLSHPDIFRYQAMCYIILSDNLKAADCLKHYLELIPDDKADASIRLTIHETISELSNEKNSANVVDHDLVPVQNRHYTLSSEISYAVLDLDNKTHVVTIGAEDERDPDDGAQDGNNDGIFQMSSVGFEQEFSQHPKLVGLVKRAQQ